MWLKYFIIMVTMKIWRVLAPLSIPTPILCMHMLAAEISRLLLTNYR
jgi:hypothetical protein